MNVMELENTENSAAVEASVGQADAESELRAPCWAVVSFEKCVAGNLTYEQAADKLAALKAEKVSGLCIITDEAANRIKN